MTELNVQNDTLSVGVKRRKVRKGTRNCWECRRRKVRCTTSSPSINSATPICDNCKRRGTSCISQEEFPDAVLPSTDRNQLDARVGRGDEFIESVADHSPNTRRNRTRHASTESLPDAHECTAIPSPESLDSEPPASSNPANIPDHPTPPLRRRLSADKYEEISKALITAWPSQSELDLIITFPVGFSAQMHCGIRRPYSSTIGVQPPSAKDVLRLPPPGSHPVLIARKLLTLGIFLQGVLPSEIKNLEARGFYHRKTMDRAVGTAIRYVTTNDEMIGSLEGIECILMEAFYHNYIGSLHRAWMAVRRAITVAQMMALHKGLNSPSLRFLEPETRATFDIDHIFFRLVEMDRYFSLMLGLPQIQFETTRFASPKALEVCQPLDRMLRIHCAVAGRILQRNDSNINNLTETHEIDKTLQKAAACMPAQWWLAPDLDPNKTSDADAPHQMIRLMAQLAHYHLLVRLHLPYMLRCTSDHRYDHSKITAVNVSREILSRYLVFHTSNPAHYYCRGSDFLAFISITVLCLAYINYHSQEFQRLHDDLNTGSVFNFLVHNRPSDRGMMERALSIIEDMATGGTDAISSKISRVLGHLLAIEANAAEGTNYNTNKGDGQETECDGELTQGGKALHVHIPYFGTINFERGSVSRTLRPDMLSSEVLCLSGAQQPPALDYASTAPTTGQMDYSNPQTMQSQYSSNVSDSAMEWLTAPDDNHDLQGVDLELFDSLFRGFEYQDEAWPIWPGNNLDRT